jgi:phage tail sheath gpL-like
MSPSTMPGDIRVPAVYAEFNAGQPPYSGTSRTVLIGRMLNTGSAAIGTPVNIGAGDPNALFGAGSMLADMAVYARYHNPVGEIWALPAANPGGAVAATKTITVTGPATAGGTLVLYVCRRALRDRRRQWRQRDHRRGGDRHGDRQGLHQIHPPHVGAGHRRERRRAS